MVIGIDARLWSQTGVGRYIRNLVINLQEIDKKNNYVLFVGNKDCENVKSQISNSKWKIIRTDIKWHTVSEQIKFASVLNKEKLDLVHFPYFSVPIFYNKPFVVTIHDLIVHHFPTGKASTLAFPIYELKLIAYKLVIKKAAEKAKKIITVSNATKDEVVDHLGVSGEKITVIYNGLDKNLSGVSKTEQLIKVPYFLYVGNAYPHKNLERLLSAFSKFLLNNKNTKLVLVGREDYFYKRLKNRVKTLKLENSLIFYQEADDKKLVNLYSHALALIMPSLMEGFGLPALEAMANSCLVLASDIPSLKEICQDAAIYFNPQDVNDMEEKLELAAQNPKSKNELIKKGLERGLIFSWEKSAKATLQVYESCLSL